MTTAEVKVSVVAFKPELHPIAMIGMHCPNLQILHLKESNGDLGLYGLSNASLLTMNKAWSIKVGSVGPRDVLNVIWAKCLKLRELVLTHIPAPYDLVDVEALKKLPALDVVALIYAVDREVKDQTELFNKNVLQKKPSRSWSIVLDDGS